MSDLSKWEPIYLRAASGPGMKAWRRSDGEDTVLEASVHLKLEEMDRQVYLLHQALFEIWSNVDVDDLVKEICERELIDTEFYKDIIRERS